MGEGAPGSGGGLLEELNWRHKSGDQSFEGGSVLANYMVQGICVGVLKNKIQMSN